MFARIVEFVPKFEKKDDLVKAVRFEVLPLLKNQPGFMELLPFEPETKSEKVVAITLWSEKKDAERYEREALAKVEKVVKPYLASPISSRCYNVETSLCRHFVEALTA
jgi:heme-degrading monooxygenase HmoA